MKAIVTALALIMTACGTESKDAGNTLVAQTETTDDATTTEETDNTTEIELDWMRGKVWVADWSGCDFTLEFNQTEYTRSLICGRLAQVEKGTYSRTDTKIDFTPTHSTCSSNMINHAKYSYGYTHTDGVMTVVIRYDTTLIFGGESLDSKTEVETGCMATGTFVPSELNPV